MTRLSCSDLRTLFEETPTSVVLVDDEGVIREVNEQSAELFGYRPEELEGEPVEVLVPDGLMERHEVHREAYTENPTARPMGIGLELEGQHRDGNTIPLEISLSPVEIDDGTRVMAAIRDVSERRELRGWGARSMEAAEEERLRIAQELHDDLAQRLAALQVSAKVLGQAPDEQRDELLAQLREEIRRSSEFVRQVIRGLRPPALSDLGLSEALRQEARRLLEDTGVERSIEIGGLNGHLPERSQLALFRITQEAVRNAVEHAEASWIAVRARENGSHVEVRIEDDGEGFDPERVAQAGDRYGLIGMRERAGAVGGRLNLESEPGEGTRIRVKVPATTPPRTSGTSAGPDGAAPRSRPRGSTGSPGGRRSFP